MAFKLTKGLEVQVAKTTASRKSHDMQAVWKLSWMKNLKAEQTSPLNKNYHLQYLFNKERPPNEGYSAFSQKVWKAFKFESMRRVIIVQLHITVVKVQNFDSMAMWQMLCQNYSQQELYQCFLAVAALAPVQAGCMELIVRVRVRKYLSIAFIFRISETLIRGGHNRRFHCE